MIELLLAQTGNADGTVALLRDARFLVFGSLTLIVIIPSLAHYWHLNRLKEMDASLKHEMLQRGFSADEIASVINSGTKKSWTCRSSRDSAAAEANRSQSTFG